MDKVQACDDGMGEVVTCSKAIKGQAQTRKSRRGTNTDPYTSQATNRSRHTDSKHRADGAATEEATCSQGEGGFQGFEWDTKDRGRGLGFRQGGGGGNKKGLGLSVGGQGAGASSRDLDRHSYHRVEWVQVPRNLRGVSGSKGSKGKREPQTKPTHSRCFHSKKP